MASHTIAVPSPPEKGRERVARPVARGVVLGPWLCGLLLAAALPVTATSPLRMSVSPAMSTAPSTIRIMMRVEPDAKNRVLEVVADSSDFYRSSIVPLEGKDTPRTFVVEYPALPSGDYVVSGTLSDDTGHVRACERRNVILMGPGREP